MPKEKKRTIMVVSTFPPRECGLAKYSMYLSSWFGAIFGDGCEMRVTAMNRDAVSRFRYPDRVDMQINQESPSEYVKAAQEINRLPHVKLVHVQHEFGIYGGEFGSHLLKFTEALEKPFVINFHTVLPEPPDAMRSVVSELSRQAGRVIAMTGTSRRLLTDVFHVNEDKVVVVPHGNIPMPHEGQARAKARLGLSGRTVLLTFGLLSRNKGIEYVIESLPEIVRRHPEVIYLVVGATHPDALAGEGETYRQSLVAKVYDLGLVDNVRFYDEFVSEEVLQSFLHACDIYVSTSLDPNQAVSGTLSFALGSGRPVISTAFAQAREFVTPETGILVGFRDPRGYSDAIGQLLEDPERRAWLGGEAFARTRCMTWPNVVLATMRVYASLDPGLKTTRLRPPPIKLTHLERLTDDFGMLQFSVRNQPNAASGYTVDDNARALIAAVRHHSLVGGQLSLDLADTYLGFLGQAGHPAAFAGMFGKDRRPEPNPSGNQDDAKGRLIMALAEVAAIGGLPPSIIGPSCSLLDEWLDSSPDFDSPRAAAFLVIGLSVLRRAGSTDSRLEPLIVRHCDRLAGWYEAQRGEDWDWFEPCISYSNGTVCEALLSGGRLMNNPRWSAIGRTTLDFLVGVTFRDGQYVAIGQNGWCHRDGPRSIYDQQPEDAAAMVSALSVMAEIDPSGPYASLRRTAFEWFLGRNTLGQFVYNVATGGCYDGLGEHAVNLNQGAESTVAYLLARLAMEGARPEA